MTSPVFSPRFAFTPSRGNAIRPDQAELALEGTRQRGNRAQVTVSLRRFAHGSGILPPRSFAVLAGVVHNAGICLLFTAWVHRRGFRAHRASGTAEWGESGRPLRIPAREHSYRHRSGLRPALAGGRIASPLVHFDAPTAR